MLVCEPRLTVEVQIRLITILYDRDIRMSINNCVIMIVFR